MNNNNFKIIQKNRLKVVISNKDFFVGESILFICCEESKVPTQYLSRA